MVRQFARSVPYPAVGNSFADSVYQYMPNSTDFALFKDRGFAGLNFAFIHGETNYHVATDTIDRLDESTLQHQGSYLLALARQLGNQDLAKVRDDNVVFFDISGIFLLYPESWVRPLALVGSILMLGLIGFGWARGRLATRGIVRGFLALLLCLLAAPSAVFAVIWVSAKLDPSFRWMPFGGYDRNYYAAASVALAAAVIAGIHARLWKRVSLEDSTVAGLLLWWIPVLATAWWFPGNSYLFVWPFLGGLAGAAVLLAAGERRPLSRTALAAVLLAAVPGVLLLPPMIAVLFVGLTVRSAPIIVVFVVLLLSLLSPQLYLMSRPRRWLPAQVAALAGSALAVAALLLPNFDRDRPKPNSVFYVMDPDTREARWASRNRQTDDWTGQFFNEATAWQGLGDFLPWSTRHYLQSKAPVAPVDGPTADVLSDSEDAGGVRRLRLLIRSQRRAPMVQIDARSSHGLRLAEVDKRLIDSSTRDSGESRDQIGLTYFGVPPEGFELSLMIQQGATVELRVVDQSFVLPPMPEMSVAPRPEEMMAYPGMSSDTTSVHRRFSL